MKFELHKCKGLHLNLGHRSGTTGKRHALLSCKCLDVSESGNINHGTFEEQVTKHYFKRVKKPTGIVVLERENT